MTDALSEVNSQLYNSNNSTADPLLGAGFKHNSADSLSKTTVKYEDHSALNSATELQADLTNQFIPEPPVTDDIKPCTHVSSKHKDNKDPPPDYKFAVASLKSGQTATYKTYEQQTSNSPSGSPWKSSCVQMTTNPATVVTSTEQQIAQAGIATPQLGAVASANQLQAVSQLNTATPPMIVSMSNDGSLVLTDSQQQQQQHTEDGVESLIHSAGETLVSVPAQPNHAASLPSHIPAQSPTPPQNLQHLMHGQLQSQQMAHSPGQSGQLQQSLQGQQPLQQQGQAVQQALQSQVVQQPLAQPLQLQPLQGQQLQGQQLQGLQQTQAVQGQQLVDDKDAVKRRCSEEEMEQDSAKKPKLDILSKAATDSGIADMFSGADDWMAEEMFVDQLPTNEAHQQLDSQSAAPAVSSAYEFDSLLHTAGAPVLAQQLGAAQQNPVFEYRTVEGPMKAINPNFIQNRNNSQQSRQPTATPPHSRPNGREMAPPSNNKLQRRKRCGQCPACLVKENCERCKNCLNRKVLKQTCIERKCVMLRDKPKRNDFRQSPPPSTSSRVHNGTVGTAPPPPAAPGDNGQPQVSSNQAVNQDARLSPSSAQQQASTQWRTVPTALTAAHVIQQHQSQHMYTVTHSRLPAPGGPQPDGAQQPVHSGATTTVSATNSTVRHVIPAGTTPAGSPGPLPHATGGQGPPPPPPGPPISGLVLQPVIHGAPPQQNHALPQTNGTTQITPTTLIQAANGQVYMLPPRAPIATAAPGMTYVQSTATVAAAQPGSNTLVQQANSMMQQQVNLQVVTQSQPSAAVTTIVPGVTQASLAPPAAAQLANPVLQQPQIAATSVPGVPQAVPSVQAVSQAAVVDDQKLE